MAHITRYRVEGLAGRSEPVEGELDRHVNVFFGDNGRGKTTLLKILNAAMENDAKFLKRLSFSRAEVAIYSIDREAELVFTFDRSRATERMEADARDLHRPLRGAANSARRMREQAMNYTPKWEVTQPTMPSRTPPTGRYQHKWLGIERIFGSWTEVQRATREADADGYAEDNFKSLADFAAQSYDVAILEALNKAQAQGLAAVLATQFGDSAPRVPTTDDTVETIHGRVSMFFKRQQHMLTSEPERLSSLEEFASQWDASSTFRNAAIRINEIEKSIEESIRPKTALQTLVNKMLVDGKKIYLQGRLTVELADGKRLDPSLLSSGEKHLIFMLMEQLDAASNSIIIDEPEMSLHVNWQGALLEALREVNKNAQLIMATHSPEILAACNRYAPTSVKRL